MGDALIGHARRWADPISDARIALTADRQPLRKAKVVYCYKGRRQAAEALVDLLLSG